MSAKRDQFTRLRLIVSGRDLKLLGGRRKARGRKNSMTMPFQRLNTHYGIHLCPITIVRYWVGGSLQYLVHWKKKKVFSLEKLYIIYTWQGSLLGELNLWRNSHMLHTQTTQAHIDRVGEQWTIAAAKKKNHPQPRVPLVCRFILFYFPITIVINQNCCGGFVGQTLRIYFTPNFHSLQYLVWVFLITHQGALDSAQSWAWVNVNSGLGTGQYIGPM